MKPQVFQSVRSGRQFRLAGFSLVELLVVLVIMGVLSGVALPAYTRYVQRGHRTEAMAALLESQHFMERYYSANGQYLSPANAVPLLPQRLQLQKSATRNVLPGTRKTGQSVRLMILFCFFPRLWASLFWLWPELAFCSEKPGSPCL